jgi:glutamine amidotransferase
MNRQGTARIALIDYGIGNLRSVEKALQAVGGEINLTEDPQTILSAEKVVLPGVGAFGDGMAGLPAGWRKLSGKCIALAPRCWASAGNAASIRRGEGWANTRAGAAAGRVLRFPENGLKYPRPDGTSCISKVSRRY